jgi:para-aminobenzoate synthetase component I
LSNDFFTIISLNKTSTFLKFHELESGFVYFKNHRINLKNSVKEEYPISKFFNLIEQINFKSEFKKPRVFHLFYELGHIINGNQFIKENDILAIDLQYLRESPYNLKSSVKDFKVKEQKSIAYHEYKKKFSEGKKQIVQGNSYQLNLTFPFEFSLSGWQSFDELIGKIWDKKEHRGAYAHASYIPTLNKIFISNSPECLFQIKKRKSSLILWSMPIKGTLKVENKNDYKKAWDRLRKCPKNQAELFMISDLLKNDLSKIEKPNAKIIFTKKPLMVPKILHQYSLISVELSQNVNLAKIVLNLFPGGSVIGAPKKRSMEILFELESKIPRAFYCGSTIILHKSLFAGSINIRSATLDIKTEKFVYGSGGGVTLLSLPREEFAEMNLKFQSFLKNILN